MPTFDPERSMALATARRAIVAAAGSFDQASAQATLNSMADAVLCSDTSGVVIYLNPAAEAMTGWSRGTACGHTLEEVFRVADSATRMIVRRDGRQVPIEDSTAPLLDGGGELAGSVIVFRDVGPALAVSRRMSALAQHDVLTALPNRSVLHDRLTGAIAFARRHRTMLAVLFVDVDRFKDVNDRHGHATGDELLRSIGARLTRALRESDTVSRYGGDEFVIVLSEVAHAADAALVANKIACLAGGIHDVGGHNLTVTLSVGVSICPEDGLDADALIARADRAMYAAKGIGPAASNIDDAGTNDSTREQQSFDWDAAEALHAVSPSSRDASARP